MSENMKRGQKCPRTVEYAKRKRPETPETTQCESQGPSKSPTVNPYNKLGASTLITLIEYTSEYDHGKLDLLRRALVAHYQRDRESGETTLSYSWWRQGRSWQTHEEAVTALERAIVEAIE